LTRLIVAAMTIAASTDRGRLAKSGARTIEVARMRPAVMSVDACVRVPAASPVAD